MKSKKVVKSSVLMVIILIVGTSYTTIGIGNNNFNTFEKSETHIIEDPRVPYVGQETDFFCGFASFTMLIKYFDVSATLNEVLHHSGVGHTSAHFRPRKLGIAIGTGLCIGKGHYKTGTFLASLYGLSYGEWNTKITKDNWNEYWSNLKDKIKQDIPMVTCINPIIMNPEFYRDALNISDDETPTAGHAIVIVGFNESAGLVYYNEPGPDAFGANEENWTYANVSIEIFKKSFQKAGPNYNIWYFESSPDPPLSKKEAFNKSYERNIKRLKGEYYENIWGNIPYTSYGVEAVKALKNDLKIGLRNRFVSILSMKIYKIINFTFEGDLINSFQMKRIATEKQYVSQYLLENKYLSSICTRDGKLFAQESKHWYNLSLLLNEFFIAANNGPIKARILLGPIIEKMKKELEEIIFIEKEIIELKERS